MDTILNANITMMMKILISNALNVKCNKSKKQVTKKQTIQNK